MALSPYPSKLSLPQINPGVDTILEYLIAKFPAISPQVWQQRAADGKLHRHDGSLITAQSPYQSQLRVYYYREVECEPHIPFQEQILFQDEQLLVAYKPPFLPVTPGGRYVTECLQYRLRQTTGIAELRALHRLDRATTGLVMFSVNPETCADYYKLFATRQIDKTYQAIAQLNSDSESLTGKEWQVRNRLEVSEPRFLMRVNEGKANSYTWVRCLKQSADRALFELKPVTGKTHQLRVHMQTLGFPIINDRYYPRLQPQQSDKYDEPLQLLAKELRFIDPVNQQSRVFSCATELQLD